MNFKGKLKFTTGILAVVALCAGLFVYLDYSLSRVDSRDAQLSSDSYSVGIDYPGIVEKQYVQVGDTVKAKDLLFVVRSTTLGSALKNKEVLADSLIYDTTEDGLISITATAPGQIRTINFLEGAFVPANNQIAIINSQDKAFITATYKLSSPDYTRLSKDSLIRATFPDNKTVEGRVYEITLDTVDKEVLTTVRARFDARAINTTAFVVGTPVKTSLQLESDTLYNRLKTNITSLFRPTSGT